MGCNVSVGDCSNVDVCKTRCSRSFQIEHSKIFAKCDRTEREPGESGTCICYWNGDYHSYVIHAIF